MQINEISAVVDPIESLVACMIGGYGYIGERLSRSLHELGVSSISIRDPGKPGKYFPVSDNIKRISEDQTKEGRFNFVHLATPPGKRDLGYHLLRRNAEHDDNMLLLWEKPSAHPENPEECNKLLEEIAKSSVDVLFDFPDLFNPRVQKAKGYLKGLKTQYPDFRITKIELYRGKDREADDPEVRERNSKVIVPIQYQETVHDFAFLLDVLGELYDSTSFFDVFPGGFEFFDARFEWYNPVNPESYPYKVAGKVDTIMSCDGHGGFDVEIHTDFKKGAIKEKVKRIYGKAGGKDFVVAVNTQGGDEWLAINGRLVELHYEHDQYRNIVLGALKLHHEKGNGRYSGIIPDCDFTNRTFLMSGALARACYLAEDVRVNSEEDFDYATSWFPATVDMFPKYEGK